MVFRRRVDGIHKISKVLDTGFTWDILNSIFPQKNLYSVTLNRYSNTLQMHVHG